MGSSVCSDRHPAVQQPQGLGRQEQQGAQVGQGHQAVEDIGQLPHHGHVAYASRHHGQQESRPVGPAPAVGTGEVLEAPLPVVAAAQQRGEGKEQEADPKRPNTVEKAAADRGAPTLALVTVPL